MVKMAMHDRSFLAIGLAGPISLERALLRTGFLFSRQDRSLGLEMESQANKNYLNVLLARVGLDLLDGDRLRNPLKEIDQSSWIKVWQECSGGAEGGSDGLLKIELSIMDSYLAGIARWLTGLGYVTVSCCDGHGRRLPRLDLKFRSQVEEVATLIERCSESRITYAYPIFCPNAWQSRDRFYVELLDLAESLYQQVNLRHT
jgi:hypothetical protein